MADRLHTKNTLLEDENRALKARLELVEDKCLKLDRRCTVLRGDVDLPKSILLSFDEDNLASTLSFLEPQDFAQLASTCKHFGVKTHQIGDEPVSLMKKIAYKLYEGASPWEKEVLPTCGVGDSPFFSYNELIKLRKPLKFDQLFGRDIQCTIGDKSTVRPISSPGRMKIAQSTARGRSFPAFTAVSDHVMRAGKHYVTFTCSGLDSNIDQPLWFGIVRPLSRITPTGRMFTPFDGSVVNRLRALKCPEWGDSNIHACIYRATDGHCQSTDWGFNDNEDNIPNVTNVAWDWEGMQTFEGCGKIGLLLDYDDGTLTMYKDDIKLGVMKEGLSGTYCWMVTMGQNWGRDRQDLARIKIERGSPPEHDNSCQNTVPAEKRSRIE